MPSKLCKVGVEQKVGSRKKDLTSYEILSLVSCLNRFRVYSLNKSVKLLLSLFASLQQSTYVNDRRPTVANYDVLPALISGNTKWLGNDNEHPRIRWHNVTPTTCCDAVLYGGQRLHGSDD